jgi:hypothetical protein
MGVTEGFEPEARGGNGEWEGVYARAAPPPKRPRNLLGGWCGTENENRDLKVVPGNCLVWPVRFRPGNGEAVPVHFAFRGQLPARVISNEGNLKIDTSERRFDAEGMRSGPFEDVAAVATGRVRGTGSSMRPVLAISALKRFPHDPRLFQVVKEIHQRVDRSYNPKESTEVIDDLREEYAEAFTLLDLNEEHLDYAHAEAYNPTNPFRWKAFAYLLQDKATASSLLPALDQILADPAHARLEHALTYYAVAAGKAGRKRTDTPLQKVMSGTEYPARARELASAAWESLPAPPVTPRKRRAEK